MFLGLLTRRMGLLSKQSKLRIVSVLIAARIAILNVTKSASYLEHKHCLQTNRQATVQPTRNV
jgi:hypothetical protein